MNVKLVDRNVLPRTYAAIRAEFADGGLRREVWQAARRGGVLALARRVGLTASGRASLEAVQAVLSAEWAEAGLDRVYVGDADPSVYGEGQVAAYLDQRAGE